MPNLGSTYSSITQVNKTKHINKTKVKVEKTNFVSQFFFCDINEATRQISKKENLKLK
jgi:hypothetical protein